MIIQPLLTFSFLFSKRFVPKIYCGRMNSIPSQYSIPISTQEYIIILGSGSKTRFDILSEMGFSLTVMKPDIDERSIGDRSKIGNENAKELVLLIANAKSDAILQKLQQQNDRNDYDEVTQRKKCILVTADQVVTVNGQIREKPLDKLEAEMFIKDYGLYPCRTVGSIVLTDIASGRRVQGVDLTEIHFNPIPTDIINELIEEGEVFFCAGGLMIEHPKVAPFIRSVNGTIDSVMGLSKELMCNLLSKLTKDV